MDARSPFRWALAAAVAVHVGALAWALVGTRARFESAARPDEVLLAIETDVEALPIERPPADPAAPEPAPYTALGLRPDALRVERRVVSGGGAETFPGIAKALGPGEASEPPAPERPGEWTFSPNGPGAASAGAGTGLSGTGLADAVNAGVQVTLTDDRVAHAKRAARRRLLPAFSPHDIELGLAPGREFVSMTRDHVPASRAPMVGHAVLEFQTDAAGLVLSVRVVDASSDQPEWEELAATLAKDARSRSVKVPTGADGIAVTVDVTSAVKTVSGATPTDKGLVKAWRALGDPLDAVLDAKNPAARTIAVRIVDVQVL